jgi:hypothetical protein
MAFVAVDIDDTLYSFATLARQVLADEAYSRDDEVLKRAAYAPWTQWRTPPDMMGEDRWMEIIALCHDENKILEQTPFDHAVDVVTELAQHHEVVYVSSRAAERFDVTDKWLKDSGFPHGVLTCSGSDKVEHLKRCQYLIDDRPSTLVRFVYDYGWIADGHCLKDGEFIESKQRRAFGLMTEFNAALTDVPRISLAPNWSLIRHYLKKKEVLPA